MAGYLTSRLKKFKWLRPGTIIKNTTHVFYVYPFKFFAEKLGLKRSTFSKAMKAEGFPLCEGYTKPLYLMPLYQKRRIYAGSKFPFDKSRASYKKGICPVAERLYEKELLLTTICHRGRTKKDIDLFIRAIEKIERYKKELKVYENKILNY